MKSTTLFSIYAIVIVALLASLGGISLYSLDKAHSWDERVELARKSHSLHLQLEANVFRLLKQHGDALLIGDRDGGVGERSLKAQINQNIADIRAVIANEIKLVGEDEIEELELLQEIEKDIRQVNNALLTLSASGEAIETSAQIENLADLLDRKIDIHLTQLIEEALNGEIKEVEETLDDAADFRTWNTALVYSLLLLSITVLGFGILSFSRQFHAPLNRLKHSLTNMRERRYASSIALGGCQEFQELSDVMGEMAESLSKREANRAEQQHILETTVQHRTSELQIMIDKLELGEENRKRLMADISHELRTPLAIILGEAEVALRNDRALSDASSDTLARIRDSANHTNQIVDDMLTVARQEAGQLRLDRREVDLRGIVEEAARMFPQDISLNLPLEPAKLSIDVVRIRQCVLALFQNARRYGGPTIEATLKATANGFQIAVSDDGPGLSIVEQAQAFDRFFRGSNASSEGIEGSGLGLPVVKSIVEAHDGHIELSDAEQGGLCIQIDLPRLSTVRAVDSALKNKSA